MSGKTNGGGFNPKYLSLFSYTYNNPVNLLDPDGKRVITFTVREPLRYNRLARNPYADIGLRPRGTIAQENQNTLNYRVDQAIQEIKELSGEHITFISNSGKPVNHTPAEATNYENRANELRSEYSSLVSRWDRGKRIDGTLSYGSSRESAEDHYIRHNDDFGKPISRMKYLRKAANFNFRGASKGRIKEDGSITYRRSDGEFIIMREDRIVSYGKNKK